MLLGVTIEAPSGTTATPTPASPRVQADPNLPAWTILYYASADNEAAPYVWRSLNQMELVGSSEQVRIVADVDWPQDNATTGSQPVRYFVDADPDPNLVLSNGAAMLEEANFGAAETLTDFLAWGMQAFPARQYALILGGYGGGWQGCCLDIDTGRKGGADHLSLAEITSALEAARTLTGESLSVIAFSGSLMNQIEVLQALQPYAGYAVASPELVPAAGWDYQTFLGALVADPAMDGRQLAAQMVADYVSYQRDLLGNPFVAMTATDLSRVTALTTAVDTLGLALTQSPEPLIVAAGDAWRGAQSFGQALTSAAEPASLLDLHQAATILATVAPTVDLEVAARAVAVAVEEAAIAYDYGSGLPGARGIAVYWPDSVAALDSNYLQTTRLTGWASFLNRFASVMESNRAPTVEVTANSEQPVSSSQPGLVQAEVIGQQLTGIEFTTALETADGRQLLVQQEKVPPPTAPIFVEPPAYFWPDGRQTAGFVWDSVAGYLYDSNGTAETVVLRTVNQAPGPGQLVVSGTLSRAGAEDSIESVLSFPLTNEVQSHVWHKAKPSALVGEVPVTVGDSFTPFQYLLGASNALELEPGARLVFDETPALYRSARRLPDNRYFVGIMANALGQQTALADVELLVDSGTAVDGYRSHVDAANRFRFLYPENWTAPTAVGEVIEATARDGATQMRLQIFPQWTAGGPALSDQVIATFGEIALLFQDEIPRGAESATTAARTVYGYQSEAEGTRTGVLLTFVQDGTGYAIDIDGPQTAEAATLAISEALAGSWQTLPVDNILNAWTHINVEGQRITYPSQLAYQELNGWHRLSDSPQSFVAVRIQPAARPIPEATSALLGIAAEGVTEFTQGITEQRYFAGHLWDQTDFTYRDGNNQLVTGLILVRQGPGQEIALWTETPVADGSDGFRQLLFTIASGITPAFTGPQ